MARESVGQSCGWLSARQTDMYVRHAARCASSGVLVFVRAVGCPVVCRAAGVMDGHPWLRGEKKILGCPCASKITHLNVYPP
jgi:hypothetical protein